MVTFYVQCLPIVWTTIVKSFKSKAFTVHEILDGGIVDFPQAVKYQNNPG